MMQTTNFQNPDHVLRQLLPPVINGKIYELWEIPRNINSHFKKTFMMKMIYLDIYLADSNQNTNKHA